VGLRPGALAILAIMTLCQGNTSLNTLPNVRSIGLIWPIWLIMANLVNMANMSLIGHSGLNHFAQAKYLTGKAVLS